MNSIIISSTIEIPHLIIQELNYMQQEVVVHSIITKSISAAEQLYSQLHKDHQIQLNGLTFIKTEGFVIFVVALDSIEKPEIILLFLYLISQYMHFEEKELFHISKIFATLQLIQVQEYAPKISEKYDLKTFKLSKKYLQLKGKPKLIIRYRMTGTLLLSLMLDFCEHYNTNKQINNNIFLGVFKRECLKRFDEIKNKQYYKQLIKIQSERKIQETGQLYHQFMDLQQQMLLKIIDILECSEIKSQIVSFLQRIQDNCHQMIKENNEKSQKFCSSLLQQYLALFNAESQNIEDDIEQKNIFVKQKWILFEEILDGYFKDAEGPFKYMISQQISSSIFIQLDKWFDSLNNHYSSKHNQQQAFILNLLEINEDFKNKLAETDRKKVELKNQNQKSIYEQEILQHQLEKLRNQNQNLENNCNQAKQKQKKFKEGLEKKQDEIDKLTYQLQEKKNELANNQIKIQILQNALDQSIWKSTQDGFQKELILQTQIFKEKLDQSTRETILSFGTRQGSDLSSIMVDKLQTKYDKIKEKRKKLKTELSQIKEQNCILQRKDEEKQTKIQNLINELSLRQSKELQISSEMTDIFLNHKNAIDQMNIKYSKLENDYYVKSIDLQHLEFYRENSLAILRESLKLAFKKTNCLLSFLKQMPQEKQSQIKEILHYFNLKL